MKDRSTLQQLLVFFNCIHENSKDQVLPLLRQSFRSSSSQPITAKAVVYWNHAPMTFGYGLGLIFTKDINVFV